jgi:hypothetical protein
MASIEHLKTLLNDTKTHGEFSHLWNDTSNSFAQREDVYAKFDDHVGKLTVGFGAPEGGGHFGTELEFGWYVVSIFLSWMFLLQTKSIIGNKSVSHSP